MEYHVHPAGCPPSLDPASDAGWARADTLHVSHFHPRSSDHRPVTRARLLYDAARLYVAFDVLDRYVRCTHTTPQSHVSQDSCVEFFVQPRGSGTGYFNFEFNCGGAMLLYFIEDPRPAEDRPFCKYVEVRPELCAEVQVRSSLPPTVSPERTHELAWSLRALIPLSLFETYVGPLGPLVGQRWRGNFFKCADNCSHPHWASWSPIGAELRFHQPGYFGTICFEEE